MLRHLYAAGAISLFLTGFAAADATIPTEDVAGSSDSDLIGRLAGAFIIDHSETDYDEMTYPLSPLVQVPGERDAHNNRKFAPEGSVTVEGARKRIVYLNAAGTSPLKVMRGYQRELEAKGAEVLFTCRGTECGGSARRGSGGGGGQMSLAMYLWPRDKVGGANFTASTCAQKGRLTDQHYILIKLPKPEAYISVHSWNYTGGTYCNDIANATIAAIDIVQTGELETEFETVAADEMASEIAMSGKIALYGILFDTAKAALKPESSQTIGEIATLLKGSPALRLLIVGHTDTEGSYDYNLDLSQRRAQSVVQALSGGHGIDKARLFPVGVSFASPVATNATDEGRAKNRRVELVSF